MRVWEKIDAFQEERGSWNGWLTALTRHAALNHARRISRHGGAEAPSEDPPSPELTPEEVLLHQERQTALGTNLWGLNCLLPGIGLVLMLLGFRLLWREEIEACRGAIQMVVSVQEFDQKGGFCRSSGSNPLCITGVRVKLTGEPTRWMIFHHFLWNTAPPFHGIAAIQLWPVYQSDELWSAAGEVAGRVLYDRGGETFRASYHSLEEDTSPLRLSGHLWTAGHFRDIFSVHCGAARAGLCGLCRR